jgi:hypothetical protein
MVFFFLVVALSSPNFYRQDHDLVMYHLISQIARPISVRGDFSGANK